MAVTAPLLGALSAGCGSGNAAPGGAMSTVSGSDAADASFADDASGGGACTKDSDCERLVPATSPANCARGVCDALQSVCRFVAKDQDGDGHTAANCQAIGSGMIETGDDCNDRDPNLYPGHPETCSATSKGTPISWPTGSPTGTCQYGQITCQSDGTASACIGAQGPVERVCSSTLDNDCDGKSDESECKCMVGTQQSCYTGPAATRGVGVCKVGTQQCENADAGATAWGTCTGETRPAARDCTSTSDNDCDGVPDDAECGTCTTNDTRPCYDGPSGTEAVGICHGGTQTCVLNNGLTTWGACVGEATPGTRTCTSASDNDCNGTADNQETACQCPGGHAPGTTVTCSAAGYCNSGTELCTANGSSSSLGSCTGLVAPTGNRTIPGSPTSITFTDGTAQNSQVGVVAAPTAAYPVTSSWILHFMASQSGNVDNTHGSDDPNGPAATVACSDGSSTVNLGSVDFSSGSLFSITCPATADVRFNKSTNWGGGCCGGYTRVFAIGSITYTGCN